MSSDPQDPNQNERVMLVPIRPEFEIPSHSRGVAFVLWMAGFFGLAGIHRFYLGRPVSGIIYLLTLGLFGFGQLIDLFLLPGMVEEENMKRAALRALAEKRALRGPSQPALPSMSQSLEKMRISLVQAAAQYDGKLSVTQGVMATGKSFEQVEQALDEMVKSGYVDVTNDEKTGVVVYDFGQLTA